MQFSTVQYNIKDFKKEVLEKKSQPGSTLFPKTFYFKDFFPQDFLVPKFQKKNFVEFFWRLPQIKNGSQTEKITYL